MRIFIKNKKFLLLLVFLAMFGIFWGFETESRVRDCNTDCSLCANETACRESKARCEWCQYEGSQTAACYKRLEIDWPSSPIGTTINRCSTLPTMVRYLYEWGISLGGLVAFITLIIAGFQYLISVGNPTQMNEAVSRITSAFFGLIVLLGSYLVLNIINPQLTTLRPLTLEVVGALYCDKDADCGTNNCINKRCSLESQKECTTDAQCTLNRCVNNKCSLGGAPCTKNEDCPLNRCTGRCSLSGTECTKIEDCSPYQCQGDPKVDDGKKEGVCMPGTKRVSPTVCTAVELYEKYKWEGSPILTVGGRECKDIPKEREIRSSHGILNRVKDKYCAGNLEIYEKPNCDGLALVTGLAPTNETFLEFIIKKAKSVKFVPH